MRIKQSIAALDEADGVVEPHALAVDVVPLEAARVAPIMREHVPDRVRLVLRDVSHNQPPAFAPPASASDFSRLKSSMLYLTS